jgi:signal peptidase II
MILAGAVGNVFDCIVYGHVIDMFCFIFWGYIYPVFNIADAAIFCGILMLLLETTRSKTVASSLR